MSGGWDWSTITVTNADPNVPSFLYPRLRLCLGYTGVHLDPIESGWLMGPVFYAMAAFPGRWVVGP